MLSAQQLTTILNAALQKLWKTPALFKTIFKNHNSIQEDYKIYAALMQDIDQPYIWSTKHSRGFYSIRYGKKSICVKIRHIDKNFCRLYNSPASSRLTIDNQVPTLVMSEHYRSLLGIETQHSYSLEIKSVCGLDIRIARDVPDPFLKLSVYLGVWGVILGIISIAITAIST